MKACTTRRAVQRGFTLLEVLVALSIVALALAAGAQATASLARNAARQSDMVLAQLCAQNTLVGLRLARQMPPLGTTSSRCPQAGRDFEVQLQVQPTPNPNFLRAQAQVLDAGVPLLGISTVVGRY